MTIESLYKIYLNHPQISTDTRKISKGCIFFALKGDNFDANTFAAQALESGAAYAVIDNEEYEQGNNYILVKDVLTTLQDLARYHRKQLTIPFIGITGTNGKTTTKELMRSVLSQRFSTYATIGNLNNHIGVPLTILSITSDIEIAIIEMGANHQQEIAFLCGIAHPTHGLITNVGKAHLEGFGGFEGVKKGKGELYDFLKIFNGTAFINQENEHLTQMSKFRNLQKIVGYGNAEGSQLKGRIIENNPLLTINWIYRGEDYIVKTGLTGIYNLENILAAICVGLHFGLNSAEINTGIELYLPGNNRSQVSKTERNTLICDYYNANPSSMAVALENFQNIQADKKVLILGDMFELGEESAEEHLTVLKKAADTQADNRIFIGKQFFAQKGNFDADFFESTDDAAKAIRKQELTGATILIKGSRGMQLEQLAGLL